MNKRNVDYYKRSWLVYILSSITLVFALKYIIDQHWMVLFWTYFAVLGISSLITDWYDFEDEGRPILRVIQYITIVSVISLFLLPILFWLFPQPF